LASLTAHPCGVSESRGDVPVAVPDGCCVTEARINRELVEEPAASGPCWCLRSGAAATLPGLAAQLAACRNSARLCRSPRTRPVAKSCLMNCSFPAIPAQVAGLAQRVIQPRLAPGTARTLIGATVADVQLVQRRAVLFMAPSQKPARQATPRWGCAARPGSLLLGEMRRPERDHAWT